AGDDRVGVSYRRGPVAATADAHDPKSPHHSGLFFDWAQPFQGENKGIQCAYRAIPMIDVESGQLPQAQLPQEDIVVLLGVSDLLLQLYQHGMRGVQVDLGFTLCSTDVARNV